MTDSRGRRPVTQCVAGALIRDGAALLVKRSPEARHYPNEWDLFGGHVEAGETLVAALRREALEELSIKIESCHRVGTFRDPAEPAEVTVFAVSEWKGEPVNAAPSEHSEIAWFAVDDLPRFDGLEGYFNLLCRAIALEANDER